MHEEPRIGEFAKVNLVVVHALNLQNITTSYTLMSQFSINQANGLRQTKGFFNVSASQNIYPKPGTDTESAHDKSI